MGSERLMYMFYRAISYVFLDCHGSCISYLESFIMSNTFLDFIPYVHETAT